MSDPRAALLAWLQYAELLGFEALPAPPLGTPGPSAGEARALRGPQDARSVPRPGPAGPSDAPSPSHVAAGDAGAESFRPSARSKPAARRPSSAAPSDPRPPRPLDELRARLAAALPGADTASRSEPPTAAPRPESSSAVAATAALSPSHRLRGFPKELLAVAPDAKAGGAPGPAPETPSLESVRALLGECERCKLHAGRTKLVFGAGNPDAELCFVGEGPGRDEDLQGLPFVGRAGQLLSDIIKAIGQSREEVYICNVVKCRPPENRTPEADEVAACRGFLFRQLQAIRPRVIVALGRPAAEALLGHTVSISKIRGSVLDFFGAKLVPTFHPAYLLRSPERKRDVWEDMKKVRALLAEA